MAALALAGTLAVVLVPSLRFAYRAPVLHIVLETGEGCIALAVAYLVGGRFRQHRRLQELLLTCGLVLLAATNLLLSAIPAALVADDQALSRWAPLTVRLLGTALVAAAALVPPARVVPARRVRPGLAGAALLLVVVGVAAPLWSSDLPPVVEPGVDLSDSSRALVAGHPLALTAQVVSGLLYAAAAVAFTRQADESPDELVRWLGAGCALAAVARIDYLLFPSLYSEFVYLGDVFRLGFYLCLLVGAAREVRSYWTRAAVLEDRRRLARDLHDGLTQELSYIYARAQRLESHPDDRRLAAQISGAAGRALDEARHAIGALTRPADQAFGVSLQQTVEDLARRYDVQAATAIEQQVVVTSEQAEALLRITGEALRNAVRHGRAGCVSVRLSEQPLALTVEDDGCGFDPAATNPRGFGLTSMRERAEGVGASFTLTSAVGTGTRVQVSWA
jgi:signal transduction histidine kinase